MNQHVYRQPACGHGRADRIDQERHVLVDDGNAHEAPPVGLAADQDGGLAVLPLARGLDHEGGCLVHLRSVHRVLAGQQRIVDPALQHLGEAVFFLAQFLDRCGRAATFRHACLSPLERTTPQPMPRLPLPAIAPTGSSRAPLSLREIGDQQNVSGETFHGHAQRFLPRRGIVGGARNDDLVCLRALDEAFDSRAHRGG